MEPGFEQADNNKEKELENELNGMRDDWKRAYEALKFTESDAKLITLTFDLSQNNLAQFLEYNFQSLTKEQVDFLLCSLRVKKFQEEHHYFILNKMKQEPDFLVDSSGQTRINP